MFATKWALGTRDAHEAFSVREAVYVQELGQKKSEVFDEKDALAAHLIVLLDERPIASSRMLFEGKNARLQYFCVLEDVRKQRFFDLMLRVMLDKAARMQLERIYIEAPARFAPYFQSFGFIEQASAQGIIKLMVETDKITWHSACEG